MRNRILFATLALLLCSLIFTAPATAVNVPACGGEFMLLSLNHIGFENGPLEITGNVMVTGALGSIHIGAFNVIHGTVTAHAIFLSAGAQIDVCTADVFTGVDPASVCGTVNIPDTLEGCTAWPPIPIPTADPCVNTALDLTVAANTTYNLLDGSCVGALRLNKNATVNVFGTVNVQSVRLLAGSKLLGPATINVQQNFVTEPSTTMSGLTLNLATAGTSEVVSIFNNSKFLSGLINAPFARVHLHTGVDFSGSEAISTLTTVEPITAACVPACF